MRREDCIRPFDTGFVLQISDDRSAIIVTRCSSLISAVSMKAPGEYRIWGGSFIGGGGSREATARPTKSPNSSIICQVDPLYVTSIDEIAWGWGWRKGRRGLGRRR
jgi:hypothetical protein